MPYSKITVMLKGLVQAAFIKLNRSLPSPQGLPGIAFTFPSLKSNLFTIAVSLKGAKRISNCPLGAPALLLLVSQGLSILVFTCVRAKTVSPFIICLVAHLFNQFFTKVETWASVAIRVGLAEASCLINVPKVQVPLTFPVCVQGFHVRVESSTTRRSVMKMELRLIFSTVVSVVADEATDVET